MPTTMISTKITFGNSETVAQAGTNPAPAVVNASDPIDRAAQSFLPGKGDPLPRLHFLDAGSKIERAQVDDSIEFRCAASSICFRSSAVNRMRSGLLRNSRFGFFGLPRFVSIGKR